MTDHIDLGEALASFDDGLPPRPTRPAQPVATERFDGSATIPLADLQAAGFNTLPPPGLQFPRQPGSGSVVSTRQGRVTWIPGVSFTTFSADQVSDMEAIRGIRSAFDTARFFGMDTEEDEDVGTEDDDKAP